MEQSGQIPAGFERLIFSGIAFFPDEIVMAIFQVAQEPDTLAAGGGSLNPAWNQAHALLSAYPQVLKAMTDHPLATRIVADKARTDPAGAWELIDEARAAYRAQTGLPVAEALTVEEAPPSAVISEESIDSATPEGAETVVVDFDAAVYEVPPVYYPAPYPAASGVVVVGEGAVPVVSANTVVVDGYYTDAVVHGGAVAGEEAAVAAVGGAAVIDTPNGAALVAGGGYGTVDTEEGTYHTQATVGAIDEQGQGVLAHREADGSWDDNSLSRSVEGQVQTTGGYGAEWEHDRSGQLTEEGFSSQASGNFEANNGASLEYDRSAELSSEGFEMDRSGSATNPQGETVEWGNPSTEQVASPSEKKAAARTSAERLRGQAAERSGERSSFANGQAGQAFSQFEKSLSDMRQGGFNRPVTLSAKEAFSAQGLSSRQLEQAMHRGQNHHKKNLQSLDHKNSRHASSLKSSAGKSSRGLSNAQPTSLQSHRGAAGSRGGFQGSMGGGRAGGGGRRR
jgi:hypothetical protein